jgi:UDP-3-O-[3-hydroxymyristoyl] glucosamine N-acyltransferase
MSNTFRLRQIAEHVGGALEGDGEKRIAGVASLAEAGPDHLSYLESDRYLKELSASEAGAVIAGRDASLPAGTHAIRVEQPVVAWVSAIELLRPYERQFRDVSPHAFIGRDVEIGPGVGIGPGAYIGNGVRLGAETEIYPGVTIGAGTCLGASCRLYAGVHIYHSCTIGDRVIIHSGAVIGADGYGFAQERTSDPAEPVRHRKVPQVGTVVIEDDVEIGASSTIDRAALGVTFIGRGTKIDNLVMVAHNCRVGRHCLLVAQVGLSGSTVLGDYVTIAGQAGLAGHLKVGSRAIIGAKAGVLSDVAEGEILVGSPALPAGIGRRAYAQIEHLPEFRKNIAELQRRVAELEKK